MEKRRVDNIGLHAFSIPHSPWEDMATDFVLGLSRIHTSMIPSIIMSFDSFMVNVFSSIDDLNLTIPLKISSQILDCLRRNLKFQSDILDFCWNGLNLGFWPKFGISFFFFYQKLLSSLLQKKNEKKKIHLSRRRKAKEEIEKEKKIAFLSPLSLATTTRSVIDAEQRGDAGWVMERWWRCENLGLHEHWPCAKLHFWRQRTQKTQFH